MMACMTPRYTRRPRPGYGPWLVAFAALLCAIAALVVTLRDSSTRTGNGGTAGLEVALSTVGDCVDGVLVERGGTQPSRSRGADAARLRDRRTAIGGTLDELRDRGVSVARFTARRCRVEVLDAVSDCAASVADGHVADVRLAPAALAVAGPTRQGYGETGATGILGADGSAGADGADGSAAAGAGAGGVGVRRSDLRLVRSRSRARFDAINARSGLLALACSGQQATCVAAVSVDGADTSRLRSVPASMSARDLALLGALLLTLVAVSLTMGRRHRRR